MLYCVLLWCACDSPVCVMCCLSMCNCVRRGIMLMIVCDVGVCSCFVCAAVVFQFVY